MQITFYLLGNADTCLIELVNGEMLLFDCADVAVADDESEKRINLQETPRKSLRESQRVPYYVVAFTNLDVDDDRIHGATVFFFLGHTEKDRSDGSVLSLFVPAVTAIENCRADGGRVLRVEQSIDYMRGKRQWCSLSLVN